MLLSDLINIKLQYYCIQSCSLSADISLLEHKFYLCVEMETLDLKKIIFLSSMKNSYLNINQP